MKGPRVAPLFAVCLWLEGKVEERRREEKRLKRLLKVVAGSRKSLSNFNEVWKRGGRPLPLKTFLDPDRRN